MATDPATDYRPFLQEGKERGRKKEEILGLIRGPPDKKKRGVPHASFLMVDSFPKQGWGGGSQKHCIKKSHVYPLKGKGLRVGKARYDHRTVMTSFN